MPLIVSGDGEEAGHVVGKGFDCVVREFFDKVLVNEVVEGDVKTSRPEDTASSGALGAKGNAVGGVAFIIFVGVEAWGHRSIEGGEVVVGLGPDGVDTIEDYVLHYMDLFDRLGLDTLDLAGFSLGAWIAAEFAIRQPDRVRRLVLIGPAGLVDAEVPAPDLFQIAPPELPSYLAHDPAAALRYFPSAPDPAFDAALGREIGSLAKLVAANPQGNPKLARWIHRLTMPTLLLWGAEDRLRPTGQSRTWLKLLPDARLERVEATGHLVLEETPASARLVTDFLAG